MRAWVGSFGKKGGRRRSAAIREAIYRYHLNDGRSTLDELVGLISQQAELLQQLSRQMELIQAELEQLRRHGPPPPVDTPPPASSRNEQKLKNLTQKFF